MDGSMPVGTVLGERWRIIGVLGSGGFGRVYEVEDTSEVGLGLGALKVLHPNTSPQERTSFLNEVKKMAVLRHQNLVGYLDSGLIRLAGANPATEGQVHPFLVAELCDASLDDALKGRPDPRLSVDQVTRVLDDVTAGLIHLHDRGMIHRDLKPANVLHGDGNWKLGDFGLMRDLSASGAYHRGELLMGTPLYMAPELFSTMDATAASDVYAVGVLAHVCATGRPLHTGAGAALAYNIASQPPTIDPGLDPRLYELVVRAVAADPAARPDAYELSELVAQAADPTWSPAAYQTSGPTVAAPQTDATDPTVWAAAPGPAVTPSPAATPPPATPSWEASPAPTSGQSPSWGPPAAATPAGGAPSWASAAPTPVGATPGPTTAGGSADPGWAHGSGPADSAYAAPYPAAAAPRGNRLLLVAIGAAVAVALAVVAGTAVLLAQGGADSTDDGPIAAGDTPQVTSPAEGTLTAPPTTAGGILVDPSAGQDPDPVVSAPPEIQDPLSHLVALPCEPTPLATVEAINQHEFHVDYWLAINHRNEAGALIEDTFDRATAIPPGGRVLLDIAPSEDGTVSCELSSFEVTPTDPAAVANRGAAELVSCTLDDFFDHQYNFTVRVTNPRAETVDAEVWVAIVGTDGTRLDDSFSTDLDGIPPGDTAQVDDENTFWDLDSLPPGTPVRCEITAVALDRAL